MGGGKQELARRSQLARAGGESGSVGIEDQDTPMGLEG